MFQNRDTIAAQATAAGEGGVAIVRVSGADCEAVVSRVFRAKNGKPLANRVLTYGCVMENGEIADEAMAVLMRAPHSYTRENVAEIHCHGSQALVRKILMLLMAAGARMAEPGEFTYRAFMNGRIDLAQAEGVMRMIRAGSERAMRSAVRQMEGGVSAFVRTARAEITSLLAAMAAVIDFPDEVEREVDAQVDRLQRMEPEDAAKALQDADAGALVRAALTGSDDQMSRAIRLLGRAGGPAADRMLREVLLSPTHNAYYKKKALDALRRLHAQEPFYSLQDGKLVLVRSRTYTFDAGLPKPYLRIMRDTINRMAQRYNEGQAVEFAAGMWAAYILYLDGHYPKIRNEKAWVLALDGFYRERNGKDVDWRALADEAGTTLRTMQMRRGKLMEAEYQIRMEEGQKGEEET